MKKIIAMVVTFAMLFSLSAPAFAVEADSVTHHGFYGDTYVDAHGNEIESVISETDTQYIVKLYVNGILDSTTVSDKNTWEAMVVSVENGEITSAEYDLHDYVELIVDDLPGVAPASEIETSTSYSISNRYRTDYLYQGDILYADTLTAAYEISTRNRHNETILNFSQGDAVGLIIAALCSAFGGTFGVGLAVSLGLPIIGTKVVDGFTRSVWMTDFRVSTKVYFDDIYTGLISQTYDEVIVSEMTDANNVKHTYYADDMYGYDIIWSQSSYAASGCAVAFVDKYVTQNNPNLSLPITSLPYYGW